MLSKNYSIEIKERRQQRLGGARTPKEEAEKGQGQGQEKEEQEDQRGNC